MAFILCINATQLISKYEGISWNETKKLWQLEFDFNGKQSNYYFDNERDAANTKNRVYKKMGILPQNNEIREIPNRPKKENTSQYKGVHLLKRTGKWYARLWLNTGENKYGGTFTNEIDAAKRVNQLCEEFEIPPQNPGIKGIPNQQSQSKPTSHYKGVSWHKGSKKWYVQYNSPNGSKHYGGTFNDELDAAKRVNQLCEEMQIPHKNPSISAMPNQQWQTKEKTSQYHEVFWAKQNDKWCAQLRLHRKQIYGGMFNDELDAAKSVNQLCDEMRIPYKNPGVSAMPNQNRQAKEKTSQYLGVHWNKQRKKWCARLHLYRHVHYGGTFNDELDAAKRVNQLCEQIGIPHKNPEISAIPNQKWKSKQQTSKYKGVFWKKRQKKWAVELCLHGGQKKYGGLFKDELDAAKRVNQLCKELRIPHKNPRIETITNYYENNQSESANPVFSSEIIVKDKDDNDSVNDNKRKREQDLMNDNFPIEQYYFYDKFLK